MRIKYVKVDSFRGKNFDFAPDKINLFLKPNGSGKTSLLDALRFGIAALKPEDNLKNTSVTLTLADGYEFTRELTEKNAVYKANGVKSTCEQVNATIKELTGVDVRTLKITSSAEVLMNMRPTDFLKLLIDYIPEELDIEKLLIYFGQIDPEMEKELRDNFPKAPEVFGIDKINEVYTKFYDARRDQKAVLQNKVAVMNSLRVTDPKRSMEEVEADLLNIKAGSRDAVESKKKLAEYEAAVKKRRQQDIRIEKIKQRMKEVTDKVPTDDMLRIIETKREAAEKEKSERNYELATVNHNIALFQNTLQTLEQPVCPISKKLVCTTDKTQIKKELQEALQNNQMIKKRIADRIAKAEHLIKRCIENRRIYDELKHKYAEYQKLQAELKIYTENMCEVPEKPLEAMSSLEADERYKALVAEKTNLENIAKRKELADEIAALTKQVEVYTSLVNALGDKGKVKSGIIDYYICTFEESCNARAKTFAEGYQIKFESGNGVEIKVKTPMNDDYYSIKSLSNGEKIIAVIIITDLLNQLSNAGILFIDNVEALDEQALSGLKELIETPEFADQYDHIFICGVNHDDVVNTFDGCGTQVSEIEK